MSLMGFVGFEYEGERGRNSKRREKERRGVVIGSGGGEKEAKVWKLGHCIVSLKP